jgi:uncharacterized RDD family membrane protein YckC
VVSPNKLIIETPEQVPLEFALAGIGSRFLAFLIDSLAQTLLGLLLLISALIFFRGQFAVLRESWQWALAALILLAFTLNYGYFALFEAIWNGQTPGKRAMHLRVISDSGRPITVYDALARNLLRLVDSLPALYAVGIITMFFSRQSKRLGDFVAGTVVVHEQPLEEARPAWDADETESPPGYDATRLSLEEAQLIEAFLARRATLDPATRERTARQIADRVAATLQIPPDAALEAESFLETLARHHRRTARYR